MSMPPPRMLHLRPAQHKQRLLWDTENLPLLDCFDWLVGYFDPPHF